ncbi:hypothetical protein ISN45_At01g028150 [Arabidopsis thaliana x Arabidopsis arenosa]|uniref:Uncharacterized protein n=2 Tax=Arabidopsis TaxID=3701 RepID=A0A8T2H9P6_ARASU|nr:hypothetical protein ISN45_At01g028150 [Arabidopsis thaliana x Arabidopsis arenosa]KAG7655732.1 hypothetical protein ISN44_As01g027820 [Arabidopsis suecica]
MFSVGAIGSLVFFLVSLGLCSRADLESACHAPSLKVGGKMCSIWF